MTRVDQVLGSAAPFDATAVQASAYRELLAQAGIEGELFAAEVNPKLRGRVLHLDQLRERDRDRDLLLVHYTGFVPGMGGVLEAPGPMMLVYHNITPARYFWNVQPYVATICRLGRDQLPRWVAAARVRAGVSAFNARELSEAGALDARVIPILLDPKRLEPLEGTPSVPDADPLVLAVGRLAPHKRHDLVLRAFALFQRRHAPGAALLCVGSALDPAYRRRLERIAGEVGAARVSFMEDLKQPELNAAYGAADALLSMSEHEGFCVPLLEAFHFGVPVVARRAGAMPEVGGDAVLWLEDDDDPAVAAELLRLATRDAALREELAGRGRARLEEFSFERSAATVLAAVRSALRSDQSSASLEPSTSLREERSGPGTDAAIRNRR